MSVEGLFKNWWRSTWGFMATADATFSVSFSGSKETQLVQTVQHRIGGRAAAGTLERRVLVLFAAALAVEQPRRKLVGREEPATGRGVAAPSAHGALRRRVGPVARSTAPFSFAR